MSGHELLIRHAANWASSKHRELDRDLLGTVLDLRSDYDETAAMAWPPGSAEHLLLVRWPASPPAFELDPTALEQTLDTFWRFLRATGRMTRDSATPAALVKEARRALPRMGEADADRSNWSQGRVLSEFGRTIGIDLEMSESTEEAQGKLDQITAAWNSLPQTERLRLMPDPTPKSAAGRRLTDLINQPFDPTHAAEPGDHDLAPGGFRRGDPIVAARQARDSAFTRACLRLAEWVGTRREVTSIGVLRPKVAREAYDALDIFTWERHHDRHHIDRDLPPEALELMAKAWRDSWTSAGDCIGLDRLWYACQGADLVHVSATVARRADRPAGEETWLVLGLTLVFGLVSRFEEDRVRPLIGILLMGMVSDDGRVPVGAVKEWWRSQCGFDRIVVSQGPGFANFMGELYDDQVDFVLQMFDDTGLWSRTGDIVEVTDFGLEFCVVLSNAWDDGEDLA